MNNGVTVGMKPPARVWSYSRVLRCSVALESYITGTARGRRAAQRYAEQQKNNVLLSHPPGLIETQQTLTPPFPAHVCRGEAC